MPEDLSAEQLLALADEALTPGLEGFRPKPILAYNEGRLLEFLADVMPQYVESTEIQAKILADLRHRLLEGSSGTSIGQLHNAVKYCRQCPAMANPQLPRWNVVDPDILLVTTVPLTGTDAVFVELLASAGLKSSFTCATSLTRCTLKERRSPDATEITACTQYLWPEIMALRPRIIVPLGATPTQAFLGDSQVMKVRGTIHWIGPWAVMPTVSYLNASKADKIHLLKEDLQYATRFVGRT